MAWELAQANLKVQLIDLSASLGRWTPEDWEGPFGFVKSESLSPSQLSRIQEEDDIDPVHEGWTFWVPDGPLDTRGPLESWFLAGPLHFSDPSERQFDKAWPRLLSQSLSANVYYENWDALQSKARLDLFSPFFVHRVSRRGFQNSLEWCRKKGVEVFENASLIDVQVESTQMNGVEISSEFKGVLQGQQFVWCLTSHETKKLQSRVAERLYPKGVLESDWSWIRYRFSIDLGIYQKVVPLHSVLIADLNLPWTHTNLLILQRTVKPEHFDVWMRVPTHHRFQRAYLEKMAEGILEVLKQKLPHSENQVLEMPQDYLYDFNELGPSLFPVFSFEKLIGLSLKRFTNMAYDGPEHWQSLDWNGRFERQGQIVAAMRAWKQRDIEIAESKKGRSDRTLHAP